MKKKKFYKKVRTKYDSKGGILSSLIAVLAICLFGASIFYSVVKGGAASSIVGKISAVSLILALIGFVLGMVSFKEKDKFERFSWIGSLANGAVLVMYVCMMLIYS
ncbi:MAG: hypothetical protein E7269_02830 [Lachnospiraceae bacterium]|nr:hypothetical protein [Lachnospiraceae bacterium]